MTQEFSETAVKRMARRVLEIELEALELSKKSIDDQFLKAVDVIAKTKGRVVVLGIGKSGIIGRKISATLASTGTPSFFVHPVEALHGDLGMIMPGDVILAISFSGQTEEINKILPSLERRKLTIIGMTGNAHSKLALMSDIHLTIHIEREACPYNLAPTASTTATLAVGDALALCLMKIKHFEKRDFAVFHPGGSLGKLLTQQVKDLMRKGKNNPTVRETASVKDALFVMTQTGAAGATSIVDGKGHLLGYFTDGDLRRLLQNGSDLLNKNITEVMTRNPHHILDTLPAIDAAKMIHSTHVDNLPVLDKSGKVVGIIDEKDLIEYLAFLDKK
ncbi:KpsF/GutQ family sugar-phosphate isomerase [Candidatus Avelusimicrobium fimicolum]|jgi:arabinose-5-phosphate isomerase|uniref:KpsF/GutQ family sugar-phosphate isomerase n=1 Tax=Candidatus Avelusimicrobium TaxID=2840538 RepID=UPI002A87A47C|nr:KpsF/GutQ family sugar-phosphate isomerase [Spirochaetia bacterium]MDY3910477.1 KpsF/GutQ family sugar-phosphate isomerase [Elusimicrobiaceae bacterium]